MKKEYVDSLTSQMDNMEVGDYFNFWIDTEEHSLKECFLIVKHSTVRKNK